MKTAILLVTFAILALLGGRLLAASVISRPMSRKVFSLLGVLGCLVAFYVILDVIENT